MPGGGPSLDGTRWIACRPGFFLPVRVLSRLFRRLFLDELRAAFEAGELGFFGDLADLADPAVFARRLRDLRRVEWVVYAKPPFGGPEQVLAYLGRYTHRVAIANSRLVTVTEDEVAFRWKDYRHHGKSKVMTLDADEFIRRFLLHILPDGFHRIRHYGFLANGHRAAKLALCRALLAAPPISKHAAVHPTGPEGHHCVRSLSLLRWRHDHRPETVKSSSRLIAACHPRAVFTRTGDFGKCALTKARASGVSVSMSTTSAPPSLMPYVSLQAAAVMPITQFSGSRARQPNFASGFLPSAPPSGTRLWPARCSLHSYAANADGKVQLRWQPLPATVDARERAWVIGPRAGQLSKLVARTGATRRRARRAEPRPGPRRHGSSTTTRCGTCR